MVRFYTLPPIDFPYKYILINANRPETGLRYLKKYASSNVIKSVIIDSGVEIFRDKNVKDYPGGYKRQIRVLVSLYEKVRKILPPYTEVYVTVPDYPDDYHHRQLWLNDKVTNIERTVESIIYATEYFPNVEWLIPIQGHYRRPRSLLRMLKLLDKHGFTFRETLYGVANLCVEVDCRIIDFSVKYVYYWFLENVGYKPRLHIFGPKLKCVKDVMVYIYSFDSMAWTRPVNKKLYEKHPYSAKNEKQRQLFFQEYLNRLREIGVEVD